MPNYYIQAKRGTFNPFSFDEYVKPLNMYKEYYEKNEEAITDMQEQANLWKNIMESEKDSKLAEKYNTYVNNLNNATQQLKNGMSYNLRNQIQQLRGQSAMVKQIENAYNLRAKDIDTYNELMMKDPSRIGAFNPSQRSLQEYMSGPVTNEYGVSGDVLYKKGAIAGQAYTLRSKKSFDSTKDGVITTTTTMGLTNDDIARELNNPNSDLHKEADKILQAQGITQDVSYYNAAKNEILKGIVDGISYDTQKSYHNVPRNADVKGRRANSKGFYDDNGIFTPYPGYIGSSNSEDVSLFRQEGKPGEASYYFVRRKGDDGKYIDKQVNIDTFDYNKNRMVIFELNGKYYIGDKNLNNEYAFDTLNAQLFDYLKNRGFDNSKAYERLKKLDTNEFVSIGKTSPQATDFYNFADNFFGGLFKKTIIPKENYKLINNGGNPVLIITVPRVKDTVVMLKYKDEYKDYLETNQNKPEEEKPEEKLVEEEKQPIDSTKSTPQSIPQVNVDSLHMIDTIKNKKEDILNFGYLK